MLFLNGSGCSQKVKSLDSFNAAEERFSVRGWTGIQSPAFEPPFCLRYTNTPNSCERPSIQPDSQCCSPSELLDPVCSWTAGVAPWWENKLETGTCAGFLIWPGYCLTAFIQFPKLLPTSNCSNRRTRKNQRKKEVWFKRHFFFSGHILFGCFTTHKTFI